MADSSAVSDLWGDWTKGIATSPLITSAAPKNELDKDAFLQLLITQLQYQDPTNPVDDREFIAQMAQFSALEQMQNMNKAYTNSQAFTMIGKTVQGEYYDEAKGGYVQYAGRVESVTIKSNEPMLKIGENSVPMKSVQNVYEDYYNQSVMNSINNNISNSQNIALIGKTIQAILVDKDNEPAGYVEGKVETLRFVDGQALLIVGGKEVKPGEVISVADENVLLGKQLSIYVTNAAGDGQDKISGAVEGVRVTKSYAYVTVDGKEVRVKYIDELTSAVNSVGKSVRAESGTTGVITSVYVKGENVYAVIDDGTGLPPRDELFSDLTIK